MNKFVALTILCFLALFSHVEAFNLQRVLEVFPELKQAKYMEVEPNSVALCSVHYPLCSYGAYSPPQYQDTIYISKKTPESQLLYTATHEFGHWVWFHQLNQETRSWYCGKYNGRKQGPSSYSISMCEENFADWYALVRYAATWDGAWERPGLLYNNNYWQFTFINTLY